VSQPSKFLPSSGMSRRRRAQHRARVRRRLFAVLVVVAAAVAFVATRYGSQLGLGRSNGHPTTVSATSPGVASRDVHASNQTPVGAVGATAANVGGGAVSGALAIASPAAAAADAASLGAPGATQLTLAAANVVDPPFKHQPRAGILYDIDSGRVLWQRNATKIFPIASLTKMMTALLVVRNAPADAPVMVTRQAVDYQGSGVGELPLGHHVPLESLLYGLLLPSGNDAAIALAQHISGTLPRFVKLMNTTARALGLSCTHYVSPDGIEDANVSCPADLAKLARVILAQPRLARIVASASAVVPFPIKGHKLYLYNNNPLLREGFPGITGMKTGETDNAGLCLVATARRGKLRVGSVLLHSPNLAVQSAELLSAGFRAEQG
jgi:serine-type D-Ala-D-Ala carboxypeptidase (penicillin-binding protein 5/6)